LDKFKQNSKIKLKFRTVGGVDQEVLCEKPNNYGTNWTSFLKRSLYPMTKRRTNWKTRRY
jgi:hypothetical protein